MLVSIAAVVGFDEPGLWAMPRSRVLYWYKAVEEIEKAKREALNGIGR